MYMKVDITVGSTGYFPLDTILQSSRNVSKLSAYQELIILLDYLFSIVVVVMAARERVSPLSMHFS